MDNDEVNRIFESLAKDALIRAKAVDILTSIEASFKAKTWASISVAIANLTDSNKNETTGDRLIGILRQNMAIELAKSLGFSPDMIKGILAGKTAQSILDEHHAAHFNVENKQ